jgi:hypothetical protein
MKIYLTNQQKHFKRHLKNLRGKSVMEYDINRLKKAVSTIQLETDSIEFQTLFNYDIFPAFIMSHLTEWKLDDREMKVGDIIVQQVCIPPFMALSQKIVFGVRISEIIDEETRKGFSYETLDGHVEKGISTFTLEKTRDQVIFKIQTYSAPGSILTKLLGPIFSRPYQTYSTNKALKHVKKQIEKIAR